MRILILAALLLTACAKDEPAASGAPAGVFIGAGRNALCIAGEGSAQRAGLIVYGESDANCSTSGKLVQSGGAFVLVPPGEGECRIPLAFTGKGVTIGTVPAACDYYCGGDSTLEGAAFTRAQAATPVTDLAGEPLC